jgi:hypothetical protein
MNETRYTSLLQEFPENADMLFRNAEENARWRYQSYRKSQVILLKQGEPLMSRKMISGAAIIIAAALILVYVTAISGKNRKTQNVEKSSEYAYPSFYKGFYLTSESANSLNKLSSFLERGKTAGLNTVVMDIQTPSMKNSVTPAEHIALCLSRGFHPVARLVMFPDGLKEYPIPAELMEARLAAAEAACKAGYKEIQLDYIRFNDHGILKKLSVKEKYEIVTKVVNE